MTDAVSPATPSSPEMFVQLLLGSVVSVLMLAVFLPFAASLMLDGVILIIRGRGVRGLLIAVALTVVIAVAGVLALQFGSADASAGLPASASFLLPFCSALALVAFGVRQLRSLLGRRTSDRGSGAR